MLNRTLLIMLCLILLITTGCNDNDIAQNDQGTITVDVINNTDDIYITYAVFYGEPLAEWGMDLLPDDEIIEPGQKFSFVIPEGSYELDLFTYELYVVSVEVDIEEDTEIEVGGEGKTPLLIINESERDIHSLHISPSDADDWGDNLLFDIRRFIPAVIGAYFFFVEPGTYDIQALDDTQTPVIDLRDIDIDGGKTITFGD